MNVTYDSKTDSLILIFKPGAVVESDEEKKGIILDYDEHGDLVGLEILDASKRIPDYATFQFKVA